jgi:hypothetical protein
MSTDSCTAAKSLVNNAGDAMGLWQMKECESNATEAQGYGDRVAGWLSCSAGTEEDIRSQIRGSSWMTMLPEESGWNPTKRPKSGQAGQDLTTQALKSMNLTAEDRQYAISLLGTYAYVGDTGAVDALPQCVTVTPTLTYEDLITGGKVKMVTCKKGTMGDSCEEWGEEEVTIEGYAAKTRKVVDTLYDKLRTKTGAARVLSDEEKGFVNRIATPPLYSLVETAVMFGNGAYSYTGQAMLDLYSDLIAAEYAWATIDMYIKLFQTGRHNISTVCAKDDADYEKALARVRAKREEEAKKIFTNLDASLSSMKFIADIQALQRGRAKSHLFADLMTK